MTKYIIIDTETGGIGNDKSLLTAYLGVVSDSFAIVDELYLRTKPDDNKYVFETEAMKINGIDLAEHDKIAKTYSESKIILSEWLNKNKQKLLPVGHGIRWDIQKLISTIVDEETFWKHVSYRCLDTQTIATFAIDLGLMPSKINAGLAGLAKYFAVGKQEDYNHDAKEDAILAMNVYRELKDYFFARCYAVE